ncbi:MAG: hypothetical protein OJF47_000610 [Nitrospira sp.]|jgi:hypothetical protein|nr:MAG: hypothetical protein OJF47_000610 [Nitrospira sp.]
MSLPELFPFHGDWDRYEDELYEIYLETVVRSGLTFGGLPVRSKYRPPTKNKGYGFWHLISEGEREEERTPDIRRCERIRWVSWLVRNALSDSDITWWENDRWGNTHIVIWHENENFAVVLAKRSGYVLLKTAYWVKPYRRKDFEREREEYWRSQKG